jgi:hypothetical protein
VLVASSLRAGVALEPPDGVDDEDGVLVVALVSVEVTVETGVPASGRVTVLPPSPGVEPEPLEPEPTCTVVKLRSLS